MYVPTSRYEAWAGGSSPGVAGAGFSLCLVVCINNWGAANSWGFTPWMSEVSGVHPTPTQSFLNLAV